MEDRLPYDQILLFAFCNLTNALSTSVSLIQTLYPYASSMIMDFGLTSDRSETGYYAGYICGSLMLGRAAGSPLWGWLADKYGRKPVLVISFLSFALGSLSFGTASSFPIAVASLLFSGMFCSLSAIGKTCVSELVSPALQPRAMSLYALGWFYGQIAGYSIGGFLVHPEKLGLVSEGILVEYPYLLPNLICAVLAILMLAAVLVFYKETLPKPPSSSQLSLAPASHKSSFSFLRSKPTLRMISLYSLSVFCNTGFIETFPLWCWSSSLHGGLNLSPEGIALILAGSYAVLGTVQSFVYAKAVRFLGLIGTVGVNSLVMTPVLIGIPFLSLLAGWGLKAALAGLCLVYYLLAFNVFTSLFVLTNNCVGVVDRAKVNGCSMAIGYIIKGSTPIFVGYTFAYTSENGSVYPFNHSFVFTLLACGTAIAAFAALALPKELERASSDQYDRMSESSRSGIQLPEVKPT